MMSAADRQREAKATAQAEIEEAKKAAKRKQLSDRLEDAGWRNVSVKSIGLYTTISAVDPHGTSHAGSRIDGDSLVADLLGIGVPPLKRKPAKSAVLEVALEEAVQQNPALFPPVDLEKEALLARIADLESRPPEVREVRVEVPAPVVVEEAPADGIPDAFRSLMLPDEPPERFTERMKRRWQSLKHMQIDGTKPTNSRALPDMTEEEIAELADLEARNKTSKWLD